MYLNTLHWNCALWLVQIWLRDFLVKIKVLYLRVEWLASLTFLHEIGSCWYFEILLVPFLWLHHIMTFYSSFGSFGSCFHYNNTQSPNELDGDWEFFEQFYWRGQKPTHKRRPSVHVGQHKMRKWGGKNRARPGANLGTNTINRIRT